jgi:hypothetical protein
VLSAEQRRVLPQAGITIKNFRDKALRNGIYLLQLLCAIDSTIVDWEVTNDGSTDEGKSLNASYAISLARKIDACVFLTERDITKGNNQMIFTFVAALWTTDLSYKKGVLSPHRSFHHKPAVEGVLEEAPETEEQLLLQQQQHDAEVAAAAAATAELTLG